MNTAGFWSSDQTLFMFLPHLAKRRFHKFDVCISTLPPPTPLTPSSQPHHPLSTHTRHHPYAPHDFPLGDSHWDAVPPCLVPLDSCSVGLLAELLLALGAKNPSCARGTSSQLVVSISLNPCPPTGL